MADLEPGDRVRLIGTTDEHTSLEPGATGSVESIDELPPEITPSGSAERQVWIEWDQGDRLAMIPEAGDMLERIEDAD